jgi:hypothetical protein
MAIEFVFSLVVSRKNYTSTIGCTGHWYSLSLRFGNFYSIGEGKSSLKTQ